MQTNDQAFIDSLVSVVPSPRQLEWQKLEYYNFIHYGLNTYTGKEWGDGKTPASKFNPTALDTDQWVKVLRASGSKGIILTAKHHDGFCLFPSAYTDYTIANSPYKDGKGDIVKELAESCQKYDMKFGVYLSPWDRHEKSYGTPEYNDFFCNQLTELCTNYGPLFSLWFDGACGEGPNGKKQEYDFDRYYTLIRKLQPDAVITICGPDVRWIGNEGGQSRESEWSVVSAAMSKSEHIARISQQSEGMDFVDKSFSSEEKDLGSREALAGVKELIWYPAEMDVSITRGWFYHKSQEIFATKTAEVLTDLYYQSVGHNASLLLNVPVNKKGLISDKFATTLEKFGTRIRAEFENQIPCKIQQDGMRYTATFNPSALERIVLQEDITKSQRIERFEIFAEIDGKNVSVYEGTTVGWKQICRFPALFTGKIVVEILSCRNEPYLCNLQLFE